MAKEVAIGKRAKISDAQQHMILAVLGASLFLGAATALVMHFSNVISFNAQVITEEDQAIVSYSDVIATTGVCKKPKGETYTKEEIEKCTPNSVDVSDIPGTLRANILEGLASNQALGSVPKEDNSDCTNPLTKKSYTYEELNNIYNTADTAEELSIASQLIKKCSALRVIPDALPAFKNEEALFASLNKLFNISGWEPESLSPSGTSEAATFGSNLYSTSVSFVIGSSSNITINVLKNIERSIREFDFSKAQFTWENNALVLNAQATAYYTEQSSVKETTNTVTSNTSEGDT